MVGPSVFNKLQKPGINAQRSLEVLLDFGGITPFRIADDAHLVKSMAEKYGIVGSYSPSAVYLTQTSRGTPYKYYDGENLIVFAPNKYGYDVVAIAPMGPGISILLSQMGEHLRAQGSSFLVKKMYEPPSYRDFVKPLTRWSMSSDIRIRRKSEFRYLQDLGGELLASGFRPLKSESLQSHLTEVPDDVYSERYISLPDFRLHGRENAKLLQKLRHTYGDDIQSSGFPGLTLLRHQLDIQSVVEPDKAAPVIFTANQTPEVDDALQNDLHQFVAQWAEERTTSTQDKGEAVTNLTAPYAILLENMRNFPTGRLLCMRDRSSKELLGAVLSDISAPFTRSVVMNIALRRVRNGALAVLAAAVIDIDSNDQGTTCINFGGKESLNGVRFVEQFQPTHKLTARFLVYDPEKVLQSDLFI